MGQTLTLGDPALNLQITKQHTTVVVEPTSQMGGSYDTAEITTVFVLNNPGPATDVRFVVPYTTEAYSASVAVISAGEDAYHKRVSSLSRITKDVPGIKPYLTKIQLPAEDYDTSKELKEVARRFRAGIISVPSGQSTIKIQVSAIVQPQDANEVRIFSFRAFSPLPGTTISSGAVPLTLAVRFKGDESIHPQITRSEPSNPFGDPVGDPAMFEPARQHGEDTIFYWKWKQDPVVDFEYHYQ